MTRAVSNIVLCLATFLIAAGSLASQPESLSQSQRNASYTIEVSLDPEARMLQGTQVLTWRNIQAVSTDQLWFHLYWNGWRNSRSTWMLEDRIRGRSERGDKIDEEDWGWIEVDSIDLLAEAGGESVDLSHTKRFIAPDDGNPDDRTVMLVELPRAVEPGQTVEVKLAWRAKIPRTFARTGFRGQYFFIAHWFPKLGVFEDTGWNCHQYHAGTEYFSDYGVYEVSMTVPQAFVLGATGRLVGSQANPDGTTTHRHVQEDVHAFTWTASPDYLVVTDRFEVDELPTVDIRLLLQPEHRAQADRHLRATKVALDRYGRWYGPYPYGHVTVVDPAWQSGAGGMEYPTLFTGGTRLFNPYGGGSPEGVTIHEAGHQFWYGLVGNNEFEDAWLDEGLNTFSTTRSQHDEYGPSSATHRFLAPPGTELRGFFPVLLDGFHYSRSMHDNRLSRFRELADIDRQDTPSYLYHPSAGGALSYSKTALWLGTLERLLGWDRLQPAMALFFERWTFHHPRPEDFFDTLNEVIGEDLGWFFDQVYRSSERFDYAVDSVSSRAAAAEGFVDIGSALEYQGRSEKEKDEAGKFFRSEVVVRRHGSGVFPVDLLLVFEDEQEVRRHWDGAGRWKLFVEERESKLSHAVVDPDNVLLLDLNRTNNSRMLEPDGGVTPAKWASRWMIWLQDYLSMLTYFG